MSWTPTKFPPKATAQQAKPATLARQVAQAQATVAPATAPAAGSLLDAAIANLAKSTGKPLATLAPAPASSLPAAPRPIVLPRAAAKSLPKLPSASSPAKAKLAAATTSIKAFAGLQEAAKIDAASVVVPDEILELNPTLTEVDGFPAEQFKSLLAKTYTSLITDQPDLGSLLKQIDNNLRKYEELSYLLTPAQLGLHFDGLMKVTSTMIKTTTPKVSAAKTAQLLEKQGGLDTSLLD